MRRARFIDAAVGLLVIGGMALGLLCASGLRHRHEDGEVPHTHSHFTHAYRHHPHPHSHRHAHAHADDHVHDHAHHHGRDTTDEANATTTSRLVKAPAAHLHVSLFGWELTLPDLLGGEDAPRTSSPHRTAPGAGVMAQSVGTLPPPLPAQILSMIFDVKCVLTTHVRCPIALSSTARPAMDGLPNRGIDPPAPPLPPPRGV